MWLKNVWKYFDRFLVIIYKKKQIDCQFCAMNIVKSLLNNEGYITQYFVQFTKYVSFPIAPVQKYDWLTWIIC